MRLKAFEGRVVENLGRVLAVTSKRCKDRLLIVKGSLPVTRLERSAAYYCCVPLNVAAKSHELCRANRYCCVPFVAAKSHELRRAKRYPSF